MIVTDSLRTIEGFEFFLTTPTIKPSRNKFRQKDKKAASH
jgi:hypothetical protein